MSKKWTVDDRLRLLPDVIWRIVVLEEHSADELWSKRFDEPIGVDEAEGLVVAMGKGEWRLITVDFDGDEGVFVVRT